MTNFINHEHQARVDKIQIDRKPEWSATTTLCCCMWQEYREFSASARVLRRSSLFTFARSPPRRPYTHRQTDPTSKQTRKPPRRGKSQTARNCQSRVSVQLMTMRRISITIHTHARYVPIRTGRRGLER